jgi:hypothetical protein
MIQMSQHQMSRMSESIVVSTVAVNVRDMHAAHPELDQNALAKTVEQIVRACLDLNVSRSDCIARIVAAHVETGQSALDPKLANPLRRNGFAEHERVWAYLRGFSDGRSRVRFWDRD